MVKKKGVLSVIPVEETIIDPLYEPLKLNRYELCEHLQWLKDISHLRYGFSPYLLFDVERKKEVVETIGFLFSIGNKGNFENLNKNKLHEDTDSFPTELREEFKGKGFLLPDEVRKEEFVDGNWIIHEASRFYIIAEEDEKLKVYRFEKEYAGFFNGYKEFIEKVEKHLHLLKEYIAWDRRGTSFITANKDIVWDKDRAFIIGLEKLEKRNDIYRELRERKDKILEEHQNTKEEYRKILKQFLYHSNEFKEENYKKIAHLFRLEYPVKIKCPICEKEGRTTHYMFMCEEGKIYSMKEALLRTFEFRRARWLYLSGMLHFIHKASTHTRLSHQIGCLIVAVNALREIDVYPYGDSSMSLGEYLLMRGEMHEFLVANLLHDLGHPPLSHVLEVSPFIELDHEEITRNLILGKKTEEEKMDWYVAERYLLKMKAIKDFEYRFFENRYDPIYDVGKLKEEERMDKFLEYLEKNDEILESGIITVTEVLENFGVDKEQVVEILSGEVFCPKCKKEGKKVLAEINERGVWCKECGKKEGKEKKNVKEEVEREEKGKICDIQILNKLMDSEIDFDRIDHVKRDSDVCGLSLTSFRLLELLGSMSVILPDSKTHKDIYKPFSSISKESDICEKDEIKPYIFISEDGLKYVMDLLNTRRLIFNEVLYSDENNWINGVVNQITALGLRYLPHLKIMLPFITDPILAHFYMNDLFLGTQIEKLNKLFHGKIDYSVYIEEA